MKANQKSILHEPTSFSELRKDEKAMWELLIAGVFAIIIVYASLNIGAFINGTIGSSLYKTYPTAAGSRNPIENQSVWALRNLSTGFTTNVGMVNIACQIAVITLPLMMVMFIRKAYA